MNGLPWEAKEENPYLQIKPEGESMFPPWEQLPPEIRAVPPTLWELGKKVIPGLKYIEQEEREKLSPLPWLPSGWGEPKPVSEWLAGPKPSKTTEIAKEVQSAEEMALFPGVIRVAGRILGEVLPKGITSFFAKPISKLITDSTWYRKLTIPERGMVTQSLDDMISKGYSEAEVLRRWQNPQWRQEALSRRAKGEIPPEEIPTFEELLAQNEARRMKFEEIQKRFITPEGMEKVREAGRPKELRLLPSGIVRPEVENPYLQLMKSEKGAIGEPTVSKSIKIKPPKVEFPPSPSIYGEGWTSPLQRTLETKMPNSAPPEQVRGLLKGAGVKEDEIKWSGLEDFIKGKEKVSKPELMNYLKENQVEVKEVLKGTVTKEISDAQERAYNVGDMKEYTQLEQEYEKLSPTKFSQWQLPGGENYREINLYWGNAPKGTEYRVPSAHAYEGEPPNRLGHIRLNDRIDVRGKKLLFGEEMQSDWHQAGREKGYQGQIDISKLQTERDKLLGGKQLSELRQINPETAQKVMDIESQIYSANREAVPPAPFSKTWRKLLLKRMIKEAVDKDYDAVGWTTGEQQAARYDLSKQVKDITSYKSNEGKWILQATDNNNQVHQLIANTDSELPNIIGKDLTQKIINTGGKTSKFSGVDLKVGGEGLTKLYNELFVNDANEILKKWGVKVGETEIKTPIGREEQILTHTYGVKPTTIHSFDIPSSMRESIKKKGLELFSLAPVVAGTAYEVSKKEKEK